MANFTDSGGQEWSLAITIGDAQRIKTELSCDLLNHQHIAEIAGDPYRLVGVLYVLCKEQCDAREITAEQFGRRLAGDAIDDATESMLAAITDFFPKRQRPTLAALLTKIRQASEMGATVATEKVNSQAMEQAIQAAIDKAGAKMDAILGELSGKPPA